MSYKLKIRPLSEINKLAHNTLMETLGIEITKISENCIEAKMPVDKRTHQVHGLLHGGASVALAETLGSIGASLCVDDQHFVCVGMEINANHIRSVTNGFVRGVARPLHIGKTSQVWEIMISNEESKLICVSRFTVAVVEKSAFLKK